MSNLLVQSMLSKLSLGAGALKCDYCTWKSVSRASLARAWLECLVHQALFYFPAADRFAQSSTFLAQLAEAAGCTCSTTDLVFTAQAALANSPVLTSLECVTSRHTTCCPSACPVCRLCLLMAGTSGGIIKLLWPVRPPLMHRLMPCCCRDHCSCRCHCHCQAAAGSAACQCIPAASGT